MLTAMMPQRREQKGRLWRWIVRKIRALAAQARSLLQARRARPPTPRRPARARPIAREHADERTIRRIAEAEGGGLSTRESDARYERGENPGGLHHKAVRREGPGEARHHLEEPRERKEKVPGGERHLAAQRRGS